MQLHAAWLCSRCNDSYVYEILVRSLEKQCNSGDTCWQMYIMYSLIDDQSLYDGMVAYIAWLAR